MALTDRQNTTNWTYGSIFLVVALLLIGFNMWLRFSVVPEAEAQKKTEELAVQSLRTQQNALLKPEVRDLFEKYSLAMEAVDIIFSAREEVFTGALDPDDYEPVMLLDYPDFFERFQKLLAKKAVIGNLTIDAYGRISFLVQTTSFHNAAQQLKAFRFGLSEQQQRRTSREELEEEGFDIDEEDIPVIFRDVVVSAVTRNLLKGEVEDIPEVLRNGDSTYDFVIQMQLNPDYYSYLLDLKYEAEEIENTSNQ